MTSTLKAITHEALELPRGEQLWLAHYLLKLGDEPANPEVEEAWEEEIAARMKAYDEGRLPTVPWEEVKRDIEARLRECK